MPAWYGKIGTVNSLKTSKGRMNALMKKLLSLLLVLCMLLGAGAAFADDAVEAGSVW